MRSSDLIVVQVTGHLLKPILQEGIPLFEKASATIEPASATAPGPARSFGDLSGRAAGVGALAFAVIVVLQNVIRGAYAPANDASGREVLTHYADHRALTVVLAVTFVLSGVALATFLGAVMRRLLAGDRPAWAYTGAIGAIGIMAVFAVLVGTEEALSVVATGREPDVASIEALWALHNSVFTVLLLSVAVALLGLGRAGVAAGITPAAFERLAPVGCALLALASAAGPFIAAGDAMPIFGLGAAGFLIWLAFLVVTGRRLMQS
jgi:hypothetical protein